MTARHICPQCGTAFAEAVLCGRPHNSQTPRTDEQAALVARTIQLIGVAPDGGLGDVDMVTADFARELERENRELERDNRDVDLKADALDRIKQALSDFIKMPPDYMQNDWVADVCARLRQWSEGLAILRTIDDSGDLFRFNMELDALVANFLHRVDNESL